MSRQVLRMKYHPAKKEVSFIRFAAGKPVVIGSDSKLSKYMNEKGKFILQDHGNPFFEDIADAFDGEKTVHIEVVTTKNDYEDFEQMIEYYNRGSSIEITSNLLSELPDMEETFQIVRKHGEKAVGILKKHKLQFFDIPLENEYVKKSVELFSADVQKEIESIADKIECMADNSVNLCFAGVYSAGKSALINAILGFRVLPENIKSETARMFRIQSPKPGESVRIVFCIRRHYAELIWSEERHTFEFGAAPTENSTRKTIQETLNACVAEKQHHQIYQVLRTLNESAEIDADIKLFFPIPLDNGRVQFTIYDTPGTDSNYGEHQQVLQEALSEQTHSILIFVASPTKIEGEGNHSLLNFLKEAEKKDSKTSIDIGRSLFVINQADTVDRDALQSLQSAKITDMSDDGFSIRLADKKLFFVSAMYAYSAKAVANQIATTDETYRIEDDYNKIYRPERGRYYQHNRVATSEYATDLQIKRSNDYLFQKEQEKDLTGVFVVCSGLYALESEIAAYGEKYAAAVRAYAIIDSVDKALSTMNKSAQSLERQNQDNIDRINREIEELRSAIGHSIRAAYKKHEFKREEGLPPEMLTTLRLDSGSLQSNITGKAQSSFEKLLRGWFFGLGKVKVNEKHKNEISQRITSILTDYTDEFLKNRQKLLEKIRDEFIADVKKAICANGNISDEAKRFVLEIRPPQIKKPTNFVEFGGLYDNRKRVDRFLGIDFQYIDKNGFIQDADSRLTQITTSMATEFMDDFRETLTSVLCAIETEFTQNTEKYSLLMQAKLQDKKAMERLHRKITDAARDLSDCQEELNKVIWSVKENG